MSEFNIDSLLDGTLDDLADMPEFKPFPAGLHAITATLEYKVVNKHPCYELQMIAEETIELASADDVPLTKGATTSMLFMLDNEIGQGQFKKVLQAVATKFGAASNRALIEHVKNLSCKVVTKQRANKEKTQMYTDLVEMLVE